MHRPVEAAEDVALEVRAEDAADAAENDRIEAAVEEGEHEAEDAPDVPEGVVVLIRLRVKVEPQHEDLREKRIFFNNKEFESSG